MRVSGTVSARPYVVFELRSRVAGKDFVVERRYSEFVALRKLLCASSPAVCVPTLPSKSYSIGGGGLHVSLAHSRRQV